MAITTHTTDITLDFTFADDIKQSLTEMEMVDRLSLFDETLGVRLAALNIVNGYGPVGTSPGGGYPADWMGMRVELKALNMTPVQALTVLHAAIGEEDGRLGTVTSIIVHQPRAHALQPLA